MPARLKRSPQQLQPSDLLVMGAPGMLQLQESPLGPAPLPPLMDAYLDPRLAQAERALRAQVPAERLVFLGEPIPLAGLLGMLKHRLVALLTQAFASENRNPEDFPALKPLLRRLIHDWVSASATFLDRLHRDCLALAITRSLGHIASITASDSDPHGGGHSVLRLTFRSGASLFYKPRPVTGEWLWASLLETLAVREPGIRFAGARIFPGASGLRYGWAEAIPADFETSGPASRYWHQAGALLCLAQHTGLTDLHLGNILPTVHGPAVTDAECLATPPLSARASPFAQAVESLLATGLLPTGTAPDPSGLFGRDCPVPEITLPQWRRTAAGSWAFTPGAAGLILGNRVPATTSPLSVLPQLIAGYREIALALLAARQRLMATGSSWRYVLERQHAPRLVLRETLTYGLWISRSLAPAHLRSSGARRQAILATVGAAPLQQASAAIRRAEARSLLSTEVPRFLVLPGTRTLASSLHHPVAKRFTQQQPAQSVFSTMFQLSVQHLDEVLIPALIHACLKPHL